MQGENAMIRTAAALLAFMLVSGVSQAEELAPMQARSIALGDVTGVAYFTVGNDGYQVVATLAGSDGATPMRFTATLAAGQSMGVSVPRAAGQAPMGIEIARLGDSVFVSEQDVVTSAALD